MAIVIVEGCDGAGKGTLLKEAAQRLGWDEDFICKLPTQEMKDHWHDHIDEATPEAVLEHVTGAMLEHMNRHKLAVFDRGWPSTFVYQGSLEFHDLDPELRLVPTLIYVVQPPLERLLVRKAKRDGLGVGAGLANQEDPRVIHQRYATFRPMTRQHWLVYDEDPSVDKFCALVERFTA